MLATPPPESRVPLPAVLAGLVADAVTALDRDREAARVLLARAASLLQGQADLDHTERARSPGAVLAPWQARRVERHIDTNLDRRLPLDELAVVARLSTSYFSRAFKGSFGSAPHAFILRRRVERAQQQMLAEDMPLSQVALACGFADQAHLSRVFRRLTGHAPLAWRRAQDRPTETAPPTALTGTGAPRQGPIVQAAA